MFLLYNFPDKVLSQLPLGVSGSSRQIGSRLVVLCLFCGEKKRARAGEASATAHACAHGRGNSTMPNASPNRAMYKGLPTFRAGGVTSRKDYFQLDEGNGHKTALAPSYFSHNHFSSSLSDANGERVNQCGSFMPR